MATWSYKLIIAGNKGEAAQTLGDDREVVTAGINPERRAMRRAGYEAPLESVLLSMNFGSFETTPAARFTADVEIINGQVLEGIDLPAEVPLPGPVRVRVRILDKTLLPLPGNVEVFLYIRECCLSPATGMRQSRALPADQAAVPIPPWARNLSGALQAGINIELGDASSSFAGGETLLANDSPVPIPTFARFVRQSGNQPNAWVTFYGGRG